MILEATAFGVASYILIGPESTPSCFDDMIYGTGGAYMGQWPAGGNRNAAATKVGEAVPLWVRWRRAQAESERWAENIYSQGGGREQAARDRTTFI